MTSTEDRRPSRSSPRPSSSLPGTKSKILLHPNATGKPGSQPGTSPRRPTASLHPQHFARDFDLIGELSSNRDLYTGDKDISLYSFPSYLQSCLERSQQYLRDQGVKVGMSPLAACVLTNGLQVINTNHHIKVLIKMRAIINTTQEVAGSDLPSDDLDEILSFLRHFPISPPDTTTQSRTKLNLKAPEEIRGELGETATKLGMPLHTLGTMAIMVTLGEERSTLPDRRKDIEMYLERFWRRVDIRRAVVETWMGKLGVKVPTVR